jgi:phenylpyruvate tautomerase PptA (4-oxalocrotonate tautomerase family)
MPIVNFLTNLSLKDNYKNEISKELVKFISEKMDKPDKDIMIIFSDSSIYMGGTNKNSVFIDFKCISGLNEVICTNLSKKFLESLRKYFDIDSNRVYINYSETSKEYAWRFINDKPLCPNMKLK